MSLFHRSIVRKSLAELIGSVAKHDLAAGKWPELFQFIEQYTSSQDSQHRMVKNYMYFIKEKLLHLNPLHQSLEYPSCLDA